MKLSGVSFQNTSKNFKLNLALVLVLKLKLSIEQLSVYIFMRLLWFRVKATTKRTNFQPIKNSESVVCTQPGTKSVLFRTALQDCNGGRMHLQLAFVIKRRGGCHVTMVAKFLDHNIRELKQGRRRRQRERQKRNMFTVVARVSRFLFSVQF